MDSLSSPSAELRLAVDTFSSASAYLRTMGDREKELRKVRLVLLLLLTVNSGLVMYISWGDLVSLASAGLTYVAVVLLLGKRFGCWEPKTDGGRRWLHSVICFFVLALGLLQVPRVLQVSRLASSTSAPMLVAAAGATALGLGGCCSFLLHRRSCSKEQRQEVIFLPIRQDPRN